MSDIGEGDYVLATKYKDGDPGDQWCVGFIQLCPDLEAKGRWHVVDDKGQQFRGNGFRRVKRIIEARGRFLLENKEIISQGVTSLWRWARKKMID